MYGSAQSIHIHHERVFQKCSSTTVNAQTAVAAIGTSLALQNVDWRMVASTSLLAGIMSVLTSLVGLPEVKEDSDDEH